MLLLTNITRLVSSIFSTVLLKGVTSISDGVVLGGHIKIGSICLFVFSGNNGLALVTCQLIQNVNTDKIQL